MCFTDARKKEILSQDNAPKNNEVLKIVAEEWKQLSDRDRAYWDEEARNDKVRFVREKKDYTGPWLLPKRRAKKHPLAPKRPMSAFLKYSQQKRPMVKASNPDMSNTDVSRLLGEMWREASAAEKAPYVEGEKSERAKYNASVKKWREEQSKLDTASRIRQQSHVAEKKPSTYYEQGRFVSKMDSFEPLGLDEKPAAALDRRRVFRSNTPSENDPHLADYRPYQAPFAYTEPAPQSFFKRDGDMMYPYKHNPTESDAFKPNSAGSNRPVLSARHPRHHSQVYRPPYQNVENQNISIKSTPSEASFDGPLYPSDMPTNMYTYAEHPDPPFNPRQQRPASSHYFLPDNVYDYP
jgi:hypothetical protein